MTSPYDPNRPYPYVPGPTSTPPASGAPYPGAPQSPYPPPYGTPSAVPYSPAPYPQSPPIVVPPSQVVVVQGPPTSGAAVASLVLGILGLVTSCCSFGIFSLLAVILGHVGLHETRNNARSGRGMAVAGLVMGYVLVAPAVVFSIYVVVAGGFAAITGGTPTPTPS